MVSRHWAGRRGLAFLALAAMSLAGADASSPKAGAPSARVAPSVASFAPVCLDAPLSFAPNAGQTDARVRFLARGRGYQIFLTDTEAVLSLTHAERGDSRGGPDQKSKIENRKSVLRMRLVGAGAGARVAGEQPLPGKVNYLVGNNPRQWRSNLPTYARARFRGVYPGIDLVYYGNQGQLEYDFIVAPGADPSRISLAFDGARTMRVDARGDLVLRVAGADVRFRKPHVYQEIAGRRVPVAAGWQLGGNPAARSAQCGVAGRSTAPASADRKSKIENRKCASFRLAKYNHARPLVIDPILTYSSYLGGSIDDTGWCVAADSAGNTYVAGFGGSFDFPTTAGVLQPSPAGNTDAFVTKISGKTNEILFSTFLGGEGGDWAQGLAVTPTGDIVVGGATTSMEFPVTEGALRTLPAGNTDAFVSKITADGAALAWSTYLGGTGSDGVWDLALDADGAVYVTGETESTDFPVTPNCPQAVSPAYRDAFVAKIAADGTALAYSTYLGGGMDDGGRGITVDAAGNAVVVGFTGGSAFPTTEGAIRATELEGDGPSDAFLSVVNATGTALAYSSYLGGSNDEWGNDVALDGAGSIYVAGTTESDDLPVTAGACQRRSGGNRDAWVMKITPDGTGVLYSTYLGGLLDENTTAIAVDGSGCAFVGGSTLSDDFPTTPGAFQPTRAGIAGRHDGFVTRLTADGTALSYSTYFGGKETEWLYDLALDAQGMLHMAGCTNSIDDLTGATGANHGSWDAFVARMAPIARVAFQVQPSHSTAGSVIAPAVRVALRDESGATVPLSGVEVTISLVRAPSSVALIGTTTATTVAGIASFPTLRLDKAWNGYLLGATAFGLPVTNSTSFNVAPGPAAKLAFTAQPRTTTAGGTLTPAVKVAVQDRLGNIATDGYHNVTVALGQNPTGAELIGIKSAPTEAGVATFDGLSIEKASTRPYTLTATSGSFTAATSLAFYIRPGTPAWALFVTQPGTARACTNMAPAPQVGIHDRYGNLVVTAPSTPVTLQIHSNPAGGTLSGTLTVNTSAGVATFSSLKIDHAGSPYSLKASTPTFGEDYSAQFEVVPGAPAKLEFRAHPGHTRSGVAFDPPVTVVVMDEGGNQVPTARNGIVMQIASNPGGGRLSGTTFVGAVEGLASFANLSIDKAGAGYTLKATSGTLTQAISDPFSIVPGPPAKLAFAVQPRDTAAGASIAPAVAVTALDAAGNVSMAASPTITVSIYRNAGGGTLSGARTQTATEGTAAFTNLSINKAGVAYTLAAAATGLPRAVSAAFNVVPGPAAKLAFKVQPRTTAAGVAIAPAVQVSVLDGLGNLRTNATNRVVIALGANPGGGTLTGTLNALPVSGVATFANLKINKAGSGYTLVASSSGLTAATSSVFSVVPGAPTRLVFTAQPVSTRAGAPMPVVRVGLQDALGNLATNAPARAVTVLLGRNPTGGALSGTTTVTTSRGVATFYSLRISRPGTGYTLKAQSTDLTDVQSTLFNITP